MSALPAAIGKYRVIKELGRGASSVVYLAEDDFNQRHVAVKQIHAHLLKNPESAEKVRKALHNEAQIAGKLRHPNAVRLLDVDGDAPQPYLVFEYMQGRSLSYYTTPDQLLPIPQVLNIAYKCCSALDHAHLRGLVHRDIKPANVMLQLDGNIKVADFGAAFQTKADQTQLLGPVGSPLYIAPELIKNETPTQQSDMFSLAVMVYELLTGRQPFAADTEFAVLYKIGNENPPPPSTMRINVPPKVDSVILRAMAKDPGDRYADWPSFAEALLAASQEVPEATSKDRESFRFTQMRYLPFFEGFGDAALWETLRLGKLREYKAGTTLMREGDKGKSFMVLLEGRVSVQREGVDLVTLDAGTTLGEMCYLQPENAVRSATALAETDGVGIEIRNEALHSASGDLQLHFTNAFMQLMVKRLVATNRKLGSYASIDVLLSDH